MQRVTVQVDDPACPEARQLIEQLDGYLSSLPRSDLRIRNVLVSELVQAAVLSERERFHGRSPRESELERTKCADAR